MTSRPSLAPSSHCNTILSRYSGGYEREIYQRTSRVDACAPGRCTIHPFRLSELPKALFGHRAYLAGLLSVYPLAF